MTRKLTPENCYKHHGDMYYSGYVICPTCGRDTVTNTPPEPKPTPDSVSELGKEEHVQT